MGEIFSAISIILVFATVALDIFAKESITFISKEKPDNDKPTDVKNYNISRVIVLLKLFGVLLFYLFLFWLLLPKSVEILKTSEVDLWNFDVVNTFYFIINLGVLIFIGLTVSYIFRTFNK